MPPIDVTTLLIFAAGWAVKHFFPALGGSVPSSPDQSKGLAADLLEVLADLKKVLADLKGQKPAA